jgi:hypothetical protein
LDAAERRSLIEDEVLAIRHSGELPEVALHTALFYLQEDPEGPRLRLTGEEARHLQDAVEQRYRRILMRDLNPRYRGKPIYRGLVRAAANWGRLERFCRSDHRDAAAHRQAAAEALQAFLLTETHDVAAGRPPSAANGSRDALAAFARALGLAPADLPPGWEAVCV